MSDHLNKIHFIMYKKIILLDDFANAIASAINNKVDKEFETIERKPLDEIIDKNKIHNWILNKVNVVEDKFSYIVSYIVANKLLTKDELRKISFNMGKTNVIDVCGTFEFFNEINSILLDGMPCDRAVNVSIDGESIFIKIIKDTHTKYYTYFGVSSDIFFDLRDSYLLGILDGTKYNITGTSSKAINLFVR